MHTYAVLINETHLDFFGHVNNAIYLTLLEEARWDWFTHKGYGREKVQDTQLAPVLLEVNLKFRKEVRCHQEIVIETSFISYEGKIGKLNQIVNRGSQVCTTATISWGLLDLKKRKLVIPTPEWLQLMSDDRIEKSPWGDTSSAPV